MEVVFQNKQKKLRRKDSSSIDQSRVDSSLTEKQFAGMKTLPRRL
jgi:hypothetical protein